MTQNNVLASNFKIDEAKLEQRRQALKAKEFKQIKNKQFDYFQDSLYAVRKCRIISSFVK